MVTSPCSLTDEDEAFVPGERGTLRKSMTLMRHLLVDAQVCLRDNSQCSPARPVSTIKITQSLMFESGEEKQKVSDLFFISNNTVGDQ